MTTRHSDTDDIADGLRDKAAPAAPIGASGWLNTGSTMLNLCCSGKPNGGFAKGTFILVVGDSNSGKSWTALQCLAEAARSPRFADYALIYDNSENGALMDIAEYFGEDLAERLVAPGFDEDTKAPVFSHTIEEFYYNVDDALRAGPCIYILDSMDALDDFKAQAKFQENKKLSRKGKDAKGDYGMAKPKANSTMLRGVVAALEKTQSILIIICQTRDNTDPMSFDTATRAGGRALRFYAHLEYWTSVVRPIRKTVRDRQVEVGIELRVRVKKNRYTGKRRECRLSILHGFGVDDVGSCIDYLLEWKHWKQADKGGSITAPEFSHKGTRAALIKKIEDGNRERELRRVVAQVWSDVEAASTTNRKRRYG